jgi:hypothetical protein
MNADSAGGSPSFYVELYKYDGVSFTLISSGSASPEAITGGASVDLYYTSISVPTTALTVTDRLAVRVYVNNSGKTITFRTEGTNLAEIVTTFTTGLTALNGLTAQVQYFTTGTSGTDFTISSALATHTFNLPVASALNTGKLSNTDWVTFNAKQNAITLTTTGNSGSSTLVGSTLNVPTYTLSGLGGVSGSGTTNYLPKWTGSTALGNSQIFDNGTSVGIGTATPSASYPVTLYNPTSAFLVFNNNGGSNTFGGFRFQIAGNDRYTFAYDGNNGNFIVSRFNSSGVYQGNNITAFNSTGNVVIAGSGSATDAGYRLDVSGTFRSTLDANINGLTVGKGGGSVANNTVVGSGALVANTTGDFNVAIGTNAMAANVTGGQNVSVGRASMQSATPTLSVAIGTNAMLSAGSGTLNVAVGQDALRTSSASSRTTAIGSSSAYNTSGNFNTAIGNEALYSNTSGVNQVALGMRSLYFATGGNNIGIGYNGGYDITTGTYNTIIGTGSAGNGITTGSYNTIIGSQITGLSSSLSNTIILADGQGNQRLYINNSGNVGIGTTSPSARLHVVNSTQNTAQALFTGSSSPFILTGTWATYGQHFSSLATFIGNNAYPSDVGNNSWTRIGAAGSLVGWINIGEAGMFFASGINAASGGSRGDSKMALFPTGNLGIGVGVTDAGYKLDVNGTTRISGTELRLDNGTTGTINLYSNTPTINFFSGGGYTFGRSGTTMNLNSAGSINMQIGGNDAYAISSANGHIWRSAISGGAALGRLTTGGNLIVGGITDAGYRVDVQGTSRFTGTALFTGNIGGNSWNFDSGNGRWVFGTSTNQLSRYFTLINIWSTTAATLAVRNIASQTANSLQIENSGGTVQSAFFSDGSLGIKTNVNAGYALDVNGTARMSDVTTFTKSTNYGEIRITGGASDYMSIYASGLRAYTIGYSGSGSNLTFIQGRIYFHNQSNAYYAGVNNGGTWFFGTAWANTNTTRMDITALGSYAAIFRNTSGTEIFSIENSGTIAIGTATPNASALLDVSSTTKGFLPPRMTTTQKNAITSPAAGLVVYDTTLNKLCVYTTAWETITSV